MTEWFWTNIWWWWLFGIALSFVVLESAALWMAERNGTKHLEDWTLSDTIRRWEVQWRPLAAIVCGVMFALMIHWFVTLNP